MPSEKPPARLRATLVQADDVEHLVDPAARDAGGRGQAQQVVAGGPAGVHGLGVEQRADLPQRRGELGVRAGR